MSVFYKFKAWKEPATIAFDGQGIAVWDLKKEIIAANNLASSAKEFDLHIFDAQSNEEYKNDQFVIPRATTVVAQRLPAKKHGRGTAQYYVPTEASAATSSRGGTPTHNANWRGGHMSKRFDNQPAPKHETLVDTSALELADVDVDEAARIEQMFAQSGQQWEQQQDKMAAAKRVPFSGGSAPRPGGSKNPQFQQQQFSNRPPPNTYICYRCGQPGHWIQECPTNEDQAFDGNKHRVKRTTGIPKSFLQSVEGPTEDQKGIMVGTDGGFVIARPDMASWQKHRAAAPKNLTAAQVQNLEPQDPDLTCPIDSKLLKNAVVTPCCSTAFCEDCIKSYLKDNSSLCPECETKIKNVSQLKLDEERRARVKDYVDEMVRSSKEEGTEEGETTEKDKEEKDKPAEESEPKEADKTDKIAENPDQPAQAGIPAMNPMMVQQSIMQMMMMLSNPQLPPPMRMQLQMRVQQAQMMLMAMANQAQVQNQNGKRANEEEEGGRTSKKSRS